MIDEDVLDRGLGLALESTHFKRLGQRVVGKVRDSYLLNEDQRLIIATDRVSVFDRIVGTIPFKGQILSQIAAYWFEETKDICANHIIELIDPAVTLVKNMRPIALELVVRDYLTGSSQTAIWTHYQRGDRIYCGHELPDGMYKHQRLPFPIVTPTTKAPKGCHDRPIAMDEAVSNGVISTRERDMLTEVSLELFKRGQHIAKSRGLILADTKYEFGRDRQGKIYLIDEIHTPDSSRYWIHKSYAKALEEQLDPRPFDKDLVRAHMASRGFSGEGAPPPLEPTIRKAVATRYAEMFEHLLGRPFIPDLQKPLDRIDKAVAHLATAVA